MIFVGEISPALRQAFAEVDAPREITFFDGNYPLARWTITVCRDFRGFYDDGLANNPPRF
jgi:hypothetical protein